MIDPILDKLLAQERQSLLDQCDKLRAELDQFEQQYELRSDLFVQKFDQGELGDEMDFFDWAATWKLYQSAIAKQIVE